MSTGLPKGSSSVTSSYPKTFSSIVVVICGLAVFLVVASFLLVSHPIGSTVRGYFYDVDHSNKIDLVDSNITDSSLVHHNNSTGTEKREGHSTFINNDKIHDLSETGTPSSSISYPAPETKEKLDDGGKRPPDTPNVTDGVMKDLFLGPNLKNSTNIVQTVSIAPSSNSIPDVVRGNTSMVTGCDLFHGEWVYDSKGPLYTNNSCPVLTQMQNCQGNGRPDIDYENWRWKPAKCDLPRFDPKNFLELMRGKTLAFIGDSVARNQMESLLCILWQVEVPKNRGNKRMQRLYFRSTSTMIIRIWSSWLVHQTNQPIDFTPEGVTKLHLDLPDETFMQFIHDFDVVVLSSGHWFAKQSVYVLNNEIVGGQLWWPDKSRVMKVNNVEAFGISTETILTAMVTHPNYTGLTIVRTFSPDHYEGGAWNTGGSCTGKTKPAIDSDVVENGFTNIMHDKQVNGFNKAIEKAADKSRLELLDITKIFQYRHDGHPGPYRSPDPNKITKRGPDGRPPPQDCLHWCMPGPVDTWNEMVFEIIRRKFEN